MGELSCERGDRLRSKRVLVWINSNENEFDLHENELDEWKWTWCAPGLVLIQRQMTTRKWRIKLDLFLHGFFTWFYLQWAWFQSFIRSSNSSVSAVGTIGSVNLQSATESLSWQGLWIRFLWLAWLTSVENKNSIRVVFNNLSVERNPELLWFYFTMLCDWFKKTCVTISTSQTKPKPIATWSHSFFLIWCRLRVIALSSDWFAVWSTFVVIGHCNNCFHWLWFYDTQ